MTFHVASGLKNVVRTLTICW